MKQTMNAHGAAVAGAPAMRHPDTQRPTGHERGDE